MKMKVERGKNIKSFPCPSDDIQLIQSATASNSPSYVCIRFNFPTDQKHKIIGALGALIDSVWHTETHGSWITVSGLTDIRSALEVLRIKGLITEPFYWQIIEGFPKPYAGEMDIFSVKMPKVINTLCDLLHTAKIDPSYDDEKQNGLNETQRNIILGTLAFPLNDIAELERTTEVRALRAILSTYIHGDLIKDFIQLDVWESIQQIRNIFEHPCPQNRSESLPLSGVEPDSEIVFYKNSAGEITSERRGLLSLTARQNRDEPPVTKEAVTLYIANLIRNRLELHPNQESALRILREHGLRTYHFMAWQPKNRLNAFLDEYRELLILMIKDHGVPPRDAMHEILGLNQYESLVLLKLYRQGLRGSNLRSRKTSDGTKIVFNSVCKEVFLFLVDEIGLDIPTLLAETMRLDSFQLLALKEFYHFGLRGDHLRQFTPVVTRFSSTLAFTPSAHDALRHMLINEKLDIDSAIQEIHDLIPLQLETLVRLYSFGLRGDHLRLWKRVKDSLEHEFTSQHQSALVKLIQLNGKNPNQAVIAVRSGTGAVNAILANGIFGSEGRHASVTDQCFKLPSARLFLNK